MPATPGSGRGDTIVERLIAQVLARDPPQPVPGFYGWWARPSVLGEAEPMIAAVRISGVRGWSLLYVGIAPNTIARSNAYRAGLGHTDEKHRQLDVSTD